MSELSTNRESDNKGMDFFVLVERGLQLFSAVNTYYQKSPLIFIAFVALFVTYYLTRFFKGSVKVVVRETKISVSSEGKVRNHSPVRNPDRIRVYGDGVALIGNAQSIIGVQNNVSKNINTKGGHYIEAGSYHSNGRSVETSRHGVYIENRGDAIFRNPKKNTYRKNKNWNQYDNSWDSDSSY